MNELDALDALSQARDAVTVRRVFGEPYEKNGITLIPAAKIQGGGGQGQGTDPAAGRSGSGIGFGVNARPAGAYVVDGNVVRWQPAFDLNRAILGGQIVAVIALLVIRSVARARARARSPRRG